MMADPKLFSTLLIVFYLCCVTVAKWEIVDITIPHTEWDGVKTVLCTAHPIKANRYIKLFYPLRRMHTVLHISAAVCDVPYSDENYWECPTPGLACGAGKLIGLWAAAKDGPAWYLPEDLAMPSGSNDGYIIVQIHAPVGMILESTPDFFATGLRLNITDQKPTYFSGLATYGQNGHIPANTADFTAEAACRWPHDYNPIFGLSLHSHTMATAITGYIYRNGTFIELMRADPIYPEPIIDISNRKLVLRKGDIVAMRCILTNPTDHIVKFGYEHTDQMCDFYILYGIPTDVYGSYHQIDCFKNAQTFKLKNAKWPTDSTLPDKKGYAKLIAPFISKENKTNKKQC